MMLTCQKLEALTIWQSNINIPSSYHHSISKMDWKNILAKLSLEPFPKCSKDIHKGRYMQILSNSTSKKCSNMDESKAYFVLCIYIYTLHDHIMKNISTVFIFRNAMHDQWLLHYISTKADIHVCSDCHHYTRSYCYLITAVFLWRLYLCTLPVTMCIINILLIRLIILSVCFN